MQLPERHDAPGTTRRAALVPTRIHPQDVHARLPRTVRRRRTQGRLTIGLALDLQWHNRVARWRYPPGAL